MPQVSDEEYYEAERFGKLKDEYRELMTKPIPPTVTVPQMRLLLQEPKDDWDKEFFTHRRLCDLREILSSFTEP